MTEGERSPDTQGERVEDGCETVRLVSVVQRTRLLSRDARTPFGTPASSAPKPGPPTRPREPTPCPPTEEEERRLSPVGPPRRTTTQWTKRGLRSPLEMEGVMVTVVRYLG